MLISLGPLTQAVASANEIILNAEATKVAISPNLDYLFDQQQIYHLGQISDPMMSVNLPWRKGSQRENNLIMEPGLYWFKGQLRNPLPHPMQITLQTEYPSINVADLYLINEQNEVTTLYTNAGLNSQYSNRPTPHRNLVNNLVLPANSLTTVIWRIESEPLFQFRVTAWQPEAFISSDQHRQMLYGMLYGVLLVMALYNLFLFFSLQQKSYIYYVLYVLSSTYLIAADQGHIYQYLATDESWAKLPAYVAAYAFNAVMFSQFCVYFLNLRKYSRPLANLIRGLALACAVSIISIAITSSLTMIFVGLFTITALFIVALIAGIVVRKAGVISAGHFIIAIMILVFSLIANNMATLGLISSNELTESLAAIGTTLMLVFFSLALADLINQLQKENNEAGINMAKANDEKLKARTELLRSQMERIQLEQTTSQARLESRSKSDFLATMSHEIRRPMDSVLGMTQQMKSTTLDDKQAQYLNTIENSSQSLLAIINDLQDFAKFEAGEISLDIASFNLETLIDDCISTFSLRAVEKNLNFIADLEPSIDPVLRGDATKLRQIILNLLSNAFKFTEQGDILLSVYATKKPSINSLELTFEIQDSGIGLTGNEQQRLFTPFAHADESTYGRYGGSGLGLSISKQLAELMDGTIGVNSEAGKGSTFWFTARLLIDEQPDKSLLREKSSQLADKRVLIVDSNLVSADIIARLLRSWKMEVDTCSNIPDAEDKIQRAQENRQPFTIVLADYYLENGDSLPLARYLKADPKLNHTVFVLAAASKNINVQSELSDCGIEILLEKPVTNALLHDALIRAMEPTQQTPSQIGVLNENTSNLKVLIVEDNQANQLLIKGLLKQLDIIPDLAANGLQALQEYDQNHYDLMLMNCEMPEMDGFEASRQIRIKEQESDRSRVMIVAVSDHARSDHQAKALESGMDNYQTKPITLKGMVELLNQLQTD
jgi:signal transduction histidine kinase/CheY-like chemotaxis protein